MNPDASEIPAFLPIVSQTSPLSLSHQFSTVSVLNNANLKLIRSKGESAHLELVRLRYHLTWVKYESFVPARK